MNFMLSMVIGVLFSTHFAMAQFSCNLEGSRVKFRVKSGQVPKVRAKKRLGRLAGCEVRGLNEATIQKRGRRFVALIPVTCAYGEFGLVTATCKKLR